MCSTFRPRSPRPALRAAQWVAAKTLAKAVTAGAAMAPSVLAQNEAPVAGQVVQPVQQQDGRDAARSPASGRSPPAREPRA